IKCLANKLPVLDKLKKRKPSLYTSNEYICCKVKVTKTQDHLADCNYYEWSWINITKVAARVTWSKLSSTDQFLLPLVSYYQLVVGSHMQEILELCRSYMWGLVPNKFLEHITIQLTSNGVDLLGFGKKKKASLSKRKEVRPRRNTHLKEKLKLSGKKRQVSTSSSKIGLEKSTLLLNDSKKGIEEKSCTAISLWQVAVKSYIQCA
ncbi:7996_t:CDS:2, partial [Gigaspora rosea]